MDTHSSTADFDRDGFVLFRRFLGRDTVDEIIRRLNDFIANVVPTMPREHVFCEDVGDIRTLKQLQRLFDYDPFFHSLMFDSDFEKLASTLLRHDVVGMNMQYFNKPAQIGKPTPAHQDGYYFMLEPNEAITMWLALDDVDEENGCVRYIPGSHRNGLRNHARTQTLGFSQGIVDYSDQDAAQEIAIPAQPGDLLAHHALTIHRADGNSSSNRSRRAIGFIYYSTAAKESDEKATRQQQLESDLRSSGKI
ncbi:MAG: phytanoyl-CoA dioxygenase family protein [Planctomycetales bacterium]|nr:phytanoyl-CoA dioxygenase family protein [Planctomycetales bacterium]